MKYIHICDRRIWKLGVCITQHAGWSFKFEVNPFYFEVIVLYWCFYLDW